MSARHPTPTAEDGPAVPGPSRRDGWTLGHDSSQPYSIPSTTALRSPGPARVPCSPQRHSSTRGGDISDLPWPDHKHDSFRSRFGATPYCFVNSRNPPTTFVLLSVRQNKWFRLPGFGIKEEESDLVQTQTKSQNL